MGKKLLFALSLTIVAPLAAAPVRNAAPKPAPKAPAEAKLIQSCEAHKFETVVDTIVDGQPHKSKVKLCGVEGQSDADWVGTLKDAVRKLEANKEMAPATRDQIVAAIKAEIARLSIVATPAAPKRQAQEQPLTPLSRDYATLPPMPEQPKPAELGAPVPVPPKTEPPAYVYAPPAPPPPPVPSPSVSLAAVTPAPVAAPIAVPHFTFSCESPTDMSGPAPCAEIEGDTRLTIKADADVPQGVDLQFVRNGQPKGDISVGGLTRSGTMRVALPTSVCAGFGAGRLELRIVGPNGAEAAQSEGPFTLRC